MGIPGATVSRVYSSGAIIDQAKYQADVPNRLIRWPSDPRPLAVAIEISLEKGLTTSAASVWITAAVSLLTALISAGGTYLAAREKPAPPSRALGSTAAAPLEKVEIPPDRLLSAGPFRVVLKDCVQKTCDVTLLLRGRDSKGRLRFDEKAEFKNWLIDQFRDTTFGASEKLYFQKDEQVQFQVWCRPGVGNVIAGGSADLNWTGFNEANPAQGYAAWIDCGNDAFKASVGIGVHPAKSRVDEPAVKPDKGPPR